jgi:hypothetical protein
LTLGQKDLLFGLSVDARLYGYLAIRRQLELDCIPQSFCVPEGTHLTRTILRFFSSHFDVICPILGTKKPATHHASRVIPQFLKILDFSGIFFKISKKLKNFSKNQSKISKKLKNCCRKFFFLFRKKSVGPQNGIHSTYKGPISRESALYMHHASCIMHHASCDSMMRACVMHARIMESHDALHGIA